MIYSHTITIDNQPYNITMYSATKGTKLLVRLTKLLGRPLSMLFKSNGKKGAEAKVNINEELVGEAVKELADVLDPDQFIELVKEILGETCVGSQCVVNDFDSRFQGKLPHLFKVVGATLKVNYGDFLAEIAGLAGGLAKVKARK